MGLCDFDLIFELQSLSKTVFIVSQVSKLQNQLLRSNIGDGTLPQAIHGGTGRRPKAGGAHDKIFKEDEVAQIFVLLVLVAVKFAYS